MITFFIVNVITSIEQFSIAAVVSLTASIVKFDLIDRLIFPFMFSFAAPLMMTTKILKIAKVMNFIQFYLYTLDVSIPFIYNSQIFLFYPIST